MLINVRGAFGSGKSTIVRDALGAPNLGTKPNHVIIAQGIYHEETKRGTTRERTRAIKGTLGYFGRAIALGTYRPSNPCGGVDEFSWKGAHDLICESIRECARQYPVTLFEGQVVSGIQTRYADLAKECYALTGKQTIMVFLFPGVDECIRRVSDRSGKSVDDPRMVSSVADKYRAVEARWRDMSALQGDHLKTVMFQDTAEAGRYVAELVKEGVTPRG